MKYFNKKLIHLKRFFNFRRPKYTTELIEIYDGKIIYSQPLAIKIEELVNTMLKEGDRPDMDLHWYVYNEYLTHRQIYDLCPLLLYCKVPLIFGEFSNSNFGEELTTKEFINKVLLTESEFQTIDNCISAIRMPKHIYKIVMEVYDSIWFYLEPSTRIPRESLSALLQGNFYKEWDFFYYAKGRERDRRYALFLNNHLSNLLTMCSKENYQTVKNITERYLKGFKQ